MKIILELGFRIVYSYKFMNTVLFFTSASFSIKGFNFSTNYFDGLIMMPNYPFDKQFLTIFMSSTSIIFFFSSNKLSSHYVISNTSSLSLTENTVHTFYKIMK